MDRIADAIRQTDAKIQRLNGVGLDGKSLSELDRELGLSFDEFVAFQGLQSRAYAGGRLSAEEATTVYQALGGDIFCGDRPQDTTLATKVVVTRLMAELIAA